MALVFQTWTLRIYYDDHCTLLHKGKAAIFANNKKVTKSLTANEVNGTTNRNRIFEKETLRHKSTTHTHTHLFINSTAGT